MALGTDGQQFLTRFPLELLNGPVITGSFGSDAEIEVLESRMPAIKCCIRPKAELWTRTDVDVLKQGDLWNLI